jgi:hypothetical protein
MSFFDKLIESLGFLIFIPIFRVAFNFMLKKMEAFFLAKNPKRISFFYGYAKIVRFIVKYIIPVMIIAAIISIWINN